MSSPLRHDERGLALHGRAIVHAAVAGLLRGGELRLHEARRHIAAGHEPGGARRAAVPAAGLISDMTLILHWNRWQPVSTPKLKFPAQKDVLFAKGAARSPAARLGFALNVEAEVKFKESVLQGSHNLFESKPVESAGERAKFWITHAEIVRETVPFKRHGK